MTLIELIKSQTDPDFISALSVRNDVKIAAFLNNATIQIGNTFNLDTKTVLNLLGPIRGTVVMQAIRNIPEMVEIVKVMDQIGIGVDINHPDSSAMFSILISKSIITTEETSQILSFAKKMIGLAESNLGYVVTVNEVSNTLNGVI